MSRPTFVVSQKRGRTKWSLEFRVGNNRVYMGVFGSKESASAAGKAEVEAYLEHRSSIREVIHDGHVTLASFCDTRQLRRGTGRRWCAEGMPSVVVGQNLFVHWRSADAWIKKRYPNTLALGREHSVVYVVQRIEDNAVKIGWTSDIDRRLIDLRKESRGNVRLAAAVPGNKPDELRLHKAFAPHRIDGEWFDVDPKEVVAQLMGVA